MDLGAVQDVRTVKISNRTDYEPWRLADFYVLASDTPFASTDLPATLAQDGVSAYYFEGPAGTSLEMAIGRTARYLRVQLTGTNYLSLAEVEVMGTPAQEAAPVTATSGVFSTRPIASASAKRAAREDAVWA